MGHDVRANEAPMIGAITYNEFASGVNMSHKELGKVLNELNDDDVINSELFVNYMNESKSVYSYKYFIEKGVK